MNLPIRHFFEARSDPPSPEQFSNPGSLALDAGAKPVGGFVDGKGRLCLLWSGAVADADSVRRANRGAGSPLLQVGPAGSSRLVKGDVTPRAFAWFVVDLREGSPTAWARRWDDGPDALLGRSGALLLGLFVDTRADIRRVSLLVAAHRHGELEEAWARLLADNGFRTRLAGTVQRGLSFAEATRLSPLPWSEIQ